MPTGKVDLRTDQYVRVNLNRVKSLFQAHRDSVRIVFSESQPIPSNTAFHLLGGDRPILQVDVVDTNVWAKAETDRSSLVVSEIVNNETTPLSYDAWGRRKVYMDRSIHHGMFTYNVPVTKWKESLNSVEQSVFGGAVSLDGKLNLISNGVLDDRVKLDTFRNPRYEPNRGHLYSSSIFLPNTTRDGERRFGIFTEQSGVFFCMKGDGLYAVRRTTVGATTIDTEELITVPASIDLEKGNTFDIQFQWRGVGDYHFYINQQVVHHMHVIGTLTELSMHNPAAPIAFECVNKGDDVVLECGCVDVSSEGGEDNGKTYGSIGYNNEAGQTDDNISGFNVPILVVRNKSLFNGDVNTRDVLSLLATAYGDQRDLLRVWATRDETAITLNGQTWTDFGDGHIDYINYRLDSAGNTIANAMTFDTTKAFLVFGSRVDQDQSYSTSALFEGRTEIYQTPGDIFIFTMHRETGGQTKVGVTYEFAEAI